MDDIRAENFFDTCEWEDLVITVPKDAISMTICTTHYVDGEILRSQGEYKVSDIQIMRDTLNAYIEGKLPKYVITEKGEAYLNGEV